MSTENNDHDLLIRLDTKMDRAADDIQTVSKNVENVRHDVSVLADSMDIKIASAISGKADIVRVEELRMAGEKLHDDHETRIRKLEVNLYYATGGLAVLQIAFGVWVALFK